MIAAHRSSTTRVWWTLFVLLAAACLAWSLSAPLLSGPDESSHAARSAAVVRGQFIGRPLSPKGGDQILVTLSVPEAYKLAAQMTCFMQSPNATPSCAPAFNGGKHQVDVWSDEYRAFPLYYAAVGLPSISFPAATGVYLARVLGALACAALLASAFASALELREALAVAGVMIAVTPEVLFLTGVVNANGIEIAAAVCLWASLLALVRVRHQPSARLVARTGIALIVLLLSRGLSPLFALLALLAVASIARDGRIRHLVGRHDVRAWAAGAGAATVVAAGWIAYLQEKYPLHRPSSGLGNALRHTPTMLRQSTGVLYGYSTVAFSQHDTPLPIFVYGVWALAGVAVLVAVWMLASPRARLVVVAVLAAGLLLPITADGLGIPQIGLSWQGRYGLPLLVGVPILAGGVITTGARRRAERYSVRIGSVIIWMLASGQVVAFAATVRRFAVGEGGPLNPFSYFLHPHWSPSPGPAVLFLLMLGGGVCGLAALLSSRVRHTSTEPMPVERATP